MKLLLDTHVLVWSRLEPERLSPEALDAMGGRDAEIWLSPISLWEILVLTGKGRLTLEPDAETWIRATVRDVGPVEAALTWEVAIRSRSLDVEGADPADRFLAATAEVYELTLVTADANLLRGSGYSSLRA